MHRRLSLVLWTSTACQFFASIQSREEDLARTERRTSFCFQLAREREENHVRFSFTAKLCLRRTKSDNSAKSRYLLPYINVQGLVDRRGENNNSAATANDGCLTRRVNQAVLTPSTTRDFSTAVFPLTRCEPFLERI